jgi:uncharacterized protein YciI
MYFVITALDRPGSIDLRLKTRDAHREYLHGEHAQIQLKLAGPLLAEDGKTMIGSLIVVEAADRETVEAFSASDPYRKADLFSSVSVLQWQWNTGRPD